MNTATRSTATVLALLTATAFATLTVPSSQAAVPANDRTGHQTAHAGSTSTPDTSARERPCFTWRANWNVALDGPEPTCPLPPRR